MINEASSQSSPNPVLANMNASQGEEPERNKISRVELLRLLDLGLQTKQWRFIRQAALSWLTIYPGDFGVNLKLAQAWLMDDRPAPARTILERLISLDPEYLEAWNLLENIYRPEQGVDWKHALGCIQVLGGKIGEVQKPPVWAAWVRDAYNRLMDGRLEGAERSLQHAAAEADTQMMALYTLIRLRLAYARKDWEAIEVLAKTGRERWPGTLAFELSWAELCMRGDQPSENSRASAVQILHRCAAQDASGQVARRLWGENHNFLPLWPDKMEIFFDLPLPAAIAGKLGFNRLEPGSLVKETSSFDSGQQPTVTLSSGPIEEIIQAGGRDERLTSTKEVPSGGTAEDMRAIEQTFERLARQVKSPEVGREDWRFPVYVLFSSRLGLLQQYGQQTTEIILKEMNALGVAYKRKQGWDAEIFLPDDAEACARLGVSISQEVSWSDPWRLKLALADLDAALMKRGKMIGAVLIVGGAEVVPFHRLPNPADDGDSEVLSDNPYATLDANYFVPEWPVGRLPGEAGSDAGLLLGQLRQLNRAYAKTGKQNSGSLGIWRRLKDWLAAHLGARTGDQAAGYTAAVWRQSSATVFRLIGREKGLLASPPEGSTTLDAHILMDAQLGYFNLHGLPDSGDWYGQRDVMDSDANLNAPDYPVALSPSDLSKNGRAPKIIFSEACYGAYIVAKRDHQAMSLKFLSLGTGVVVGSTCVSYGSMISPLIGADLLASLFWRCLRQGLTAGQALMQAKIELAQEMNRRQGYLDGEDQKTLLSFILLGDPMALHNMDGIGAKRVVRLKQVPQIRMAPDIKQPASSAGPEMVRAVKQAVEKYLPGLDQAEFHVRTHPAETIPGGAKQSTVEGHTLVTISKQVQVAQLVHAQVAHVTLNDKGKMVKLAVSR